MASKEELLNNITETVNKYEHIFTTSGISIEQCYKWIKNLRNYDQVRHGNTFLHGGSKGPFIKECLLKFLLLADSVYVRFDAEAWKILKATAATHKSVKDLKIVTNEVRRVWKTRPKYKITRSR